MTKKVITTMKEERHKKKNLKNTISAVRAVERRVHPPLRKKRRQIKKNKNKNKENQGKNEEKKEKDKQS